MSQDTASAPVAGFDRLADPVKRWIWNQDWRELRDIQEQAIPAILEGGDIILAARTASGKTEAAFLPLISRILANSKDTGTIGFSALYVSPLKALINDQFRRLESLLEECQMPLHRWHGDVSSNAKQRARERPQGIVLITPESLEATLVRRGRDALRLFGRLHAIVIDELHAFIGTERGRQLQSVLNRIEIAARRGRIDRIGLSATLGDMSLAAHELRPGSGERVRVIESKDGSQELRLQVRGYRYEKSVADLSTPVFVEDRVESRDPWNETERQIADHLFAVLRDKRNLVFAGSRRNVEIYTDLLRRLSEESQIPSAFFPHHGNLAKSEREIVESRLREDPRPTTAIATSTLELGIDIGDVESVAQVGPGWSVASLRQRLGRSGRRAGQPAVLRVYISEEKFSLGLHPADSLRLNLVQAIAMILLLMERWCEPPRPSGLHLSTLVQQVLASIHQFGGMKPGTLWKLLCETGPFRAVDRSLFAEMLTAIARPEVALVEMSPDGDVMLGPRAENITSSYDFYAVFMTDEEFRIIADGRELGTVPLDKTLAPGQTIIFNGRRWRIIGIDARSRVIEVTASKAALPPRFGGELSGIHDRVVEKIREVLCDTEVPEFLDPIARELLEEARSAFFNLRLDRSAVLEVGSGCILFPWVGSVKLETLALALLERNFQASVEGHLIEIQNCSIKDIREVLREMSVEEPPAALSLATKAAKLYREKYDPYLTDELLMKALAVDMVESASVPLVAKRILEGSI